MRDRTTRSQTHLAILGALTLALASPALAGGENPPAIVLDDVAIQGNAVRIAVDGALERPVAATVFLRVVLPDGSVTTVSVRTTFGDGDSVWVPFAAPAEPHVLVPLGVVLDDGSPFGPI
jgi:hypothetical protein